MVHFQAEIAQLVEHATENCGVASPILALGTRPEIRAFCGRSTVVVRLLAKEKVVGSNPIARSLGCGLRIVNLQSSIYNRPKIGVVAKRQGKGLQNPHHGFKSRRRLRNNESARARFRLG